jgi:hypothetical protein
MKEQERKRKKKKKRKERKEDIHSTEVLVVRHFLQDQCLRVVETLKTIINNSN